mmetsp:Transcript_1970/g.2565  ORF Transcript_1970/g.2565 Transcript_1970/m.2565 type:complete len:365 (+) Transcript_1970:134-1228(+)
MQENNCIVIGAGVIGLSCAYSLVQDGWRVHIVADKFSPDNLSDGVAALWEPFLAAPSDNERVLGWSKAALDKFYSLLRDLGTNTTGIREVVGREFSQKEDPTIALWLQKLMKWRKLGADEVPEGLRKPASLRIDGIGDFKSGIEYTSLIIEIQKYMPWLNAECKKLGITFEKRKLNTVEDIISLSNHFFKPKLIVNCAGLGNYELLQDKQMLPIRGHILKVEAPWVDKFYSIVDWESEDLVYILPRSDCVIVGGTAQRNNWDLTPHPETSRQILERVDLILPGLGTARVLKEWVGLRPARSSMRVEAEKLVSTSNSSSSVDVVHCYGHSGSGVTLSWGCAEEVVRLAKKFKSIPTDNKCPHSNL